MVGQAPVKACTCPESLNLSSSETAAASWMNFPKRVPVLAKPQDGSSILKLSSARCIRTSGFSFMRVPFRWAVESLGLYEQGWCLRGHGHRQADWPKWQPTRLRHSPPPQRRSCIFLQARPAGSRNCRLSHFRWSRSEPEALCLSESVAYESYTFFRRRPLPVTASL